MVFVWRNGASKQEEALNTSKAGMEVNSISFPLHFAYAEMQEAHCV